MGRGFWVRVSNYEFKNVLKDFDKYDKLTQDRLRDAVRSGTQRVLQGTLRRMPKRTGKMASKTTMDFDAEKCTGYVRVKGPIAHLVEYGHKGPYPAPEHPFIRPSYEEVKPSIVKGVESAVKP